MEVTKVIFKKLNYFDGGIEEINTIFLNHQSTDRHGNIVYEGYANVGQHCELHEDFLTDGEVNGIKVETATEEEYRELKVELESIGYNLEVL